MDRDLIPIDGRLIESVLSPIVGQPLTDIWQAFGQYFEFGEQTLYQDKKGEEVSRSALRLKAVSPGCDWVVGKSGEIVVGSTDCRQKRRFFDRKTPPREPRLRSKWKIAGEFFNLVRDGGLIVRDVKASNSGTLTIELSASFTLIVCPTSALELDTWYFWNDCGPGVCVYASGMYVDDGARKNKDVVYG